MREIGDHWDGCWQSHYECAITKIKQLQSELAAAKAIADAAKEYIDYLDAGKMETYGGKFRRDKIRAAIRAAEQQAQGEGG